MYDTNPELDRDVIRTVIPHVALKNSPITYGDLAKAIGKRRGYEMSAQSFGATLGRIQDYCKECGLPSLSVMVTNQKGEPEVGFTEHYREIHPEAQELTDGEIVRRERAACIACKEWQSLYDYVDIHETVPKTIDLIGRDKNKPIYEESRELTKTLSDEMRVARSEQARIDCLAAKGHRCVVCEKDMEEVYGVAGIIHVHHLKPMAELYGKREVDPIKDLVPVCPNCHAVIHSKKDHPGYYEINEVRAMLGLPPLVEGSTTGPSAGNS